MFISWRFLSVSSINYYQSNTEITETNTWCYISTFSIVCVGGSSLWVLRCVKRGVGGQSHKLLPYLFFERPRSDHISFVRISIANMSLWVKKVTKFNLLNLFTFNNALFLIYITTLKLIHFWLSLMKRPWQACCHKCSILPLWA